MLLRYDWSHLGGGMPTMSEGSPDRLPKFEGYNSWKVGGYDHVNVTSHDARDKRLPLPAFQAGPSRLFNSVSQVC